MQSFYSSRGPLTGTTYRFTLACLAIIAALTLVACGGSSTMDISETGSPDVTTDTDRESSALIPGNLLPPPTKLMGRLGNHPNAACPGDGFEEQLPHHRVSSLDGGALFSPQSGRGRGRGGANGRYAFAMYHLKAPECPTDGVDDDCDGPALSLSINPLYRGGSLQGDSPLYVCVADPTSNSWNVKAQDYNSSRSNTTTAILPDLDADDDDDGDGGKHGDAEYLVALVVTDNTGRFSRIGRGGRGGRGGGILLESLSVSNGWEVSQLDDGLRSSSLPVNSSSMDGCPAPDGSHHLSIFTGYSGLHHVRCADGSCRSSSIPFSAGQGPSVGMCVDPKGTPYVSSMNSRRGIGPVRWMSPESFWRRSVYTETEPGQAFDPRFTSDVCVTRDGTIHVAHYDPYSNSLMYSSLTRDGEFHQETVAGNVRIRKRPDLLTQEWDEPVCVFRTCGDGGAVNVARRTGGTGGDMGWKYFPVADAPCPAEGTGDGCSAISADLDRDGRLDIVCSSTRGDLAIHYSLKDGTTEVSSLGSPDESSSCASVVSLDGVMYAFVYDEETKQVRYIRKRPGRVKYDSRVVAQYAADAAGVHGHVTVLKAFLDPDDDGDGLGTASCYILLSGGSDTSGDIRHWTLEVRVNRIEMA